MAVGRLAHEVLRGDALAGARLGLDDHALSQRPIRLGEMTRAIVSGFERGAVAVDDADGLGRIGRLGPSRRRQCGGHGKGPQQTPASREQCRSSPRSRSLPRRFCLLPAMPPGRLGSSTNWTGTWKPTKSSPSNTPRATRCAARISSAAIHTRGHADGLLRLAGAQRQAGPSWSTPASPRTRREARTQLPAHAERGAGVDGRRCRDGEGRGDHPHALRPCRDVLRLPRGAVPSPGARDVLRHRPLHAPRPVQPRLRGRGRRRHGAAGVQGSRAVPRRLGRARAGHQRASHRRPYAGPAVRARATARGWVVLASDASHYYEHMERPASSRPRSMSATRSRATTRCARWRSRRSTSFRATIRW